MSKIILDDDSSNLNPLRINENFRKIEEEFNERVLYRKNPITEPNEMENHLDMNGNRIYNLPKPKEPHEPLRFMDIGSIPEDLQKYVDKAEEWSEESKEWSEESKEWSEESKNYYEHTLEAISEGEIYVGNYEEGLVINNYTEFFGKDGIWYRPSPNLELPYVITGDWEAEEEFFIPIGIHDLLSPIQEGKGAFLVSGAVAYVENIEGLRETEPIFEGQLVEIGGHTVLGIGGGIFYSDFDSTEDDDSGLTIVTNEGKRWIRRDSDVISPEMFGAIGDGVTDDTQAVKKWWECPTKNTLEATGSYIITGTDEFLRNLESDFICNLGTSSFIIGEPRSFLFRIKFVNTSNQEMIISGGRFICNNNVARPLDIYEDSGIIGGSIKITDLTINEVFANLGIGYSSSSIGININVPCSLIKISNCRISNVNREYTNPGVIASVGLSVTRIIGSVIIKDNIIYNIQSPEGDEDADGISLFSRDRLLPGRQSVMVEVVGNRLNNCKGRFVKLQTTNARVHHNTFLSTDGEIIDSFYAVDCQFGGCSVTDNFWHLYPNIIGGSNSVFVLSHIRETGNWESFTEVRNNSLILERTIRYFFLGIVTSGTQQIEVSGNYIKANQSTDFIAEGVARIDCNDISKIVKCNIVVSNNTYPSNRDRVLLLVGDGFSNNASAASKFSYKITDNFNTNTPTARDNVIILATLGSGNSPAPHISNIIARNNKTGGHERINAKSMNVSQLPPGNDFYYGTDGGSGGLLGTPSALNRYSHVKTGGDTITITTNGGITGFKVGTGSWRRIDSTAF